MSYNYKTISLKKDTNTKVAQLNLSRPEKLNSLDDDMFQELQSGLREVASDSSIKALVISGEGRGFCAGADLGSSVLKSNLETTTKLLKEYHDNIILSLWKMKKIVIGALNGIAVGGGAGIALACDIRIASTKFRLGVGFRNLGVTSDFGNAYLLPRLVGIAKALELYFVKDLIDAEEALKIGLVNEVVPPEKLQQVAMDYALKIAQGPGFAMGLAKELVHMGMENGLGVVLDAEAVYQTLCLSSEDFKEGLAALKEKRKANFM
jgi:enoyl-CoA hydratase/carnithine racemase